MPDQPLAITLMSARLALRPARSADLPFLTEALSHPDFPAALPLADFYRAGKLASWLDQACKKNTTPHSAVWAIDLPSGAISVGQVALIAREQDHALSFWLSPHHWGGGLAREAVAKVLNYALSGGKVSRIWAATALWNERSAALMLASGFSEAAILDHGYTANGTAYAVRQFYLDSKNSKNWGQC
jgi:ribosomal-protein-alanine N-acetyltransferase